MNNIDYLIHVTDFEIITDIFESKYLFPQTETGFSNFGIDATDTEKIFVMIVTKNAPNMGLDWKNIHGNRKSIILLDKSLLLDQSFFVNPDWYGQVVSISFDSSKHSLKGKEFKDLIKKIDSNFNSKTMILNEVLLSEPVSLEKYFLGIYTIYGDIYQDICDVEYVNLVKPLNQFLFDTQLRTRRYLAMIYTNFHLITTLVKENYPDAFSGVIELNTDCSYYDIITKEIVEK
jgi:hypothetical protein